MSRRRTASSTDAILHVGAGMCPLPVLVAHGQRPLDHVVGPSTNSTCADIRSGQPNGIASQSVTMPAPSTTSRSSRDTMQSPIPTLNRVGAVSSKMPLSSVCFSQTPGMQLKVATSTSTALVTPRSSRISFSDTRTVSAQTAGCLSQISSKPDVVLGRRKSETCSRGVADDPAASASVHAASSAPSSTSSTSLGPIVSAHESEQPGKLASDRTASNGGVRAQAWVESIDVNGRRHCQTEQLEEQGTASQSSGMEGPVQLATLKCELQNTLRLKSDTDAELLQIREELLSVRDVVVQQRAEHERLCSELCEEKEVSCHLDTELLRLQQQLKELNASNSRSQEERARLRGLVDQAESTAAISARELDAESLRVQDAPLAAEPSAMRAASTSSTRFSRRKHCEHEKENDVNQIVNDQKRLLCVLERRLQREKLAGVMPTPNEFMKLSKRLDADGIVQENSALRQEIANLRTEVAHQASYAAVMAMYLPKEALEQVSLQLQARPFPMQAPDAAVL